MTMFNPYDFETHYLDLVEDILRNGEHIENDRTGTGMLELFGPQLEFTVNRNRFPVLTSKKTFFKGAITEMLWYLRGETTLDFLHKHRVHIWDSWDKGDGNLGPVYGKQIRDWKRPDGTSVDQFERLIDGLKNNPQSRRHIISLWNVGELDDMALPPCPAFIQFNVRKEQFLDIKLYQRSADMFLGVPFDVIAFSTLLLIVADITGYEPGKFTYSFGSAHIYANHIDQVNQMLDNYYEQYYEAPGIRYNKKDDIFDYSPSDFWLVDYESHGVIKGEISV